MGSKKSLRSLQNKTVVITGASSGAGRAIAVEAARHGAHLVLAARRGEALAEVAAECEAFGIKTLVVVTDVQDTVAMYDLAAKAIEWNGSIDVWVNNAGVLAAGAFDETPVNVHESVIKTNLLGYIHGAHAVLPYFKKQGHGVIINNISVGGWYPVPYAAAYSASKFGLRGFGEALQAELHAWPDIHVCNLYPAFLDTPGIQHAANFTGKTLRPAPPIYNPQLVAEAVVKLSVHPRRQSYAGTISPLLQLVHSVAPSLSGRLTAGVIEKYLKVADSSETTNGNVLSPTAFGTSAHGGWALPASAKQKAVWKGLAVGVLAAGAVALVGWLDRK